MYHQRSEMGFRLRRHHHLNELWHHHQDCPRPDWPQKMGNFHILLFLLGLSWACKKKVKKWYTTPLMSFYQCYQLTSLDRDVPKNGLLVLQSFMCHFSKNIFFIFPRKFETLANSQLVFNLFSFGNQGCSHHYFLICYRLQKKKKKMEKSLHLKTWLKGGSSILFFFQRY